MSEAETVDQQSPAEGDPEEFPRPFGQYLLLENFARGGMGEVYLAKIGGIAGLERYCVLKKLRAELTRDREYVTRFIDEARVVVTLNHANICHVFDVGRVGEEYYLAMEYISGRDVRTTQDRSRLKKRVMPPATALHLVCETLEALDYAHRRNHPLTGEPLNLVHRDVSPQNVLVSYEGEVKLIDFGLAASKLKVERTQPNIVMGKMAYMAPEQARGDQIDARADLFACGVLAYELLSGERFYEGMTANDIWQVAGKGGFVPRLWNTIDADLGKHLARALHPDAKKRFASCGDFREALAAYLHWRFPGTGVRGLREVMNELFADEVRKERELLAKFGTITVAGFRTSFEDSASRSVSLVRGEQAVARLVRNERSTPTAVGPMPSPIAAPPEAPRLPLVMPRIFPPTAHVVSEMPTEAMRLASPTADQNVERTDPNRTKPKDTSTDEAPVELTQRLQRRIKPIDVVKDIPTGADEEPVTDEDEQPLVLPRNRLGMALIAAALSAAAVVAVVLFLANQDGGKVAPQKVAPKVPVVAVQPAVAVAVPPPAAVEPIVPVEPQPLPPVEIAPVAIAPLEPGPAKVAADEATDAAKRRREALKTKRDKAAGEEDKAAGAAAAVVPGKAAPMSLAEVKDIGSRCEPCAQIYAMAANLLSESESAMTSELRKCIEKNRCR